MQRLSLPYSFTLAGGFASAAGQKIAPDLAEGDPETFTNVIIQYTNAPAPVNHGRVISGAGSLKQEFTSLNGTAYTVKLKTLKALAAHEDVLYISPDRAVRRSAATVSYDYMAQTVDAYGLSTSSGARIGIAVIDNRITPNQDLNNSSDKTWVLYNKSFVPGTSDAKDYYDHGTHIAGITAGRAYNSSGSAYYHEIKGIAPSATLIYLRVLDHNGAANDSQVIKRLIARSRSRANSTSASSIFLLAGPSSKATRWIHFAKAWNPPGRQGSWLS